MNQDFKLPYLSGHPFVQRRTMARIKKTAIKSQGGTGELKTLKRAGKAKSQAVGLDGSMVRSKYFNSRATADALKFLFAKQRVTRRSKLTITLPPLVEVALVPLTQHSHDKSILEGGKKTPAVPSKKHDAVSTSVNHVVRY